MDGARSRLRHGSFALLQLSLLLLDAILTSSTSTGGYGYGGSLAPASDSSSSEPYLRRESVLRPSSPPFNSTPSSFNVAPYTFALSFVAASQQRDLYYYLAISFVNGGQILRPPLWVANRNSPVSSTSNLTFSSSGDLLLYDGPTSSVAWSSGTANLGAVRLQLLDSGNLVLLNVSTPPSTATVDDYIVWQSFDHPTDTLLPGQPFTTSTAALISARQISSDYGSSSSNFSTGQYSLFFDTSSKSLKLSYVGSDNSLRDSRQIWTYWTIPITEPSTAAFRFDMNGELSLNVDTNNVTWSRNASDYGELGVAGRRLTLDADGNLRMYSWSGSSDPKQWKVVWLAFIDVCNTVPNICGTFGICIYDPRPTCVCTPGFIPSDPTHPLQLSGGCIRNPLYPIDDCANVRFLELRQIDFPFNDIDYDSITGISQEACVDLCSQRCADGCVAAVYGIDIYNGDISSCWLKSYLQNGRFRFDPMRITSIKLSGSDPIFATPATVNAYNTANSVAQPNFNGSFGLSQSIIDGSREADNSAAEHEHFVDSHFYRALLIPLCSAITLLWISCGFSQLLMIANYKAKLSAYRKLHGDLEHFSGSPIVFTYTELEAVTDKFTYLLGEGAFGKVYKGRLVKDGRTVAVKKLEGYLQNSEYEEKQFRSEIVTIGRIHHVNLVRLIGFCAEGSHRLLVYEYMPNGSLDEALFGAENDGTVGGRNYGASTKLDWATRFQICVGIGRGIKYLHEDCADCILHCDIKPHNILLDDAWCAKVADFGLAHLYSRDETVVKLTNVRGTRGYMAPEWNSGLPITAKCDVYSYGMVLMEIFSGRRNFMYTESAMMMQGDDDKFWCFPVWAYGRSVREAIDPKLLVWNNGTCRSEEEELEDGEMARSTEAINWEEAERVLRVAFACIQADVHARPSMAKVLQMLDGSLPLPDVVQPPLFPFTSADQQISPSFGQTF